MARVSGALLLAWTLSSTPLVSGCSSLASKVQDTSGPVDDGIVYYMPRRPIKVIVTVDATGKQTPSVGTIDATADLRQRFVLHYEENFVGKNHLVIGVNSNGLLTSSNADTVSGIPDIVKNLGKAIGSLSAIATSFDAPTKKAPSPPPPQTCPNGNTYTLLLYPELKTSDTLCDFQITLTSPEGSPISPHPAPDSVADSVRVKDTTHSSQSGIFYKHDLPYVVKIQAIAGGPISNYIAFSPDLAPVAFVPVTRTLFSNNTTNITLVEGTVTAVDQSSDGEIVALTELPADFISAYMGAIGNILGAIGSNTQAQTAVIANKQALAVATIKKQACTTVIEANKSTLDASNIAGKTGADLATAVSNINTALANIKAICS